MNHQGIFFSTAVMVSQLSLLPAEEVLFQLKFEPGKTYLNDSVVKQEMTMPMADRELETKMTMKSVTSQKVTKVEEGVQIVQGMESINVDMNAAGMAIKFDSENPDGPMAAVFAPFTEVGTKMILDGEGKLVSVKADVAPGMENLGMGAAELEKAATEVLVLIPNQSFSVGESWKVESSLPLGALIEEPVPLHYELTFAEMTEFEGHKVAKIMIKGEAGGEDENLKVTSKELTGVMFFDPVIGQPRELTMNVALEITVPEEIAGEGEAKMMPLATQTVIRLKEIQ